MYDYNSNSIFLVCLKLLLQTKANLIIILLITFILILVFLEIYALINSSKFPSYSWQTNNIMEDKVNNCIKKPFKKIAVFGDSHVEYHGENSSNIVVASPPL